MRWFRLAVVVLALTSLGTTVSAALADYWKYEWFVPLVALAGLAMCIAIRWVHVIARERPRVFRTPSGKVYRYKHTGRI